MTVSTVSFKEDHRAATKQFGTELKPLHTAVLAERKLYTEDVLDITRELTWEVKNNNNDTRRHAAWMYHLEAHLSLEDLQDTPVYAFVQKWSAEFAAFYNVPTDKLWTLCRGIDYRYANPTKA